MAFDSQIENRNFLSPSGFKFSLGKFPKVSFFCNSAGVPDISLGTAVQPAYLKDIDMPGDKLLYGDFTLRFLVDENLENYMCIHNWLLGLGSPESTEQFKDYVTDENGISNRETELFSDGTLYILNSNFNTTARIKFRDLFPVYLTALDFDASESDTSYFTAEATFKYTVYNILGTDGNSL